MSFVDNNNTNQCDTLRKENEELRDKLLQMEQQLKQLQVQQQQQQQNIPTQPVPKEYLTSSPSRFTPYHNLSPDALQRFSRHLILKHVNTYSQTKWLNSRVLIIGAGGLGSPVALYLAAAGIGHMTLVDSDVVDESNLHRQVIHTEAARDIAKVESAANQCRRINSSLNIVTYQEPFTTENALKLANEHDIIVDCTDNVTARYLTSDAAVYTNRPLISAAVVSASGQLTTYCYENGPCYRCVNPNPPPPTSVQSCSDAGVIGALVGVVGTMQALEALKVLANIPLLNETTEITTTTQQQQHHKTWPVSLGSEFKPLSETMMFWDGITSDIRKAKLRPRQTQCMCKIRPTTNNAQVLATKQVEEYSTLLSEAQWSCSTGPGGETVHPALKYDRMESTILLNQIDVEPQTLALLPNIQQQIGTFKYPFIVDVRPPEQFQICNLPYSAYYEAFNLLKDFQPLRDLLWEEYITKYPTSYLPNPAIDEFITKVKADDEHFAQIGETKMAYKRRHKQYNYPSKFILQQHILQQIIPSVKNEQDDLRIHEFTSDHIIHHFALDGSYNEKKAYLNAELLKLPIFHISFLCRRGRLSVHLLHMLAQHIFDKYDRNMMMDNNCNIDENAKIPTVSATFAYIAVLAGFPPILLSDISGGLTAFNKSYPEFPIY